MAVVATAEVDVRAKLDNFDRDLQNAQKKMSDFSQTTDKSNSKVVDFEKYSNAAARAVAAFGEGLDKARSAAATLAEADKRVTEEVIKLTAANDNVARSIITTKNNVEQHNRSMTDMGGSVIKTGAHLLEIASAIKLISAVAYAGSDRFKKFADSALGLGKSTGDATIKVVESTAKTAGLGNAFDKTAKAVKNTTDVLKPFMAIAGGKEILGLATGMTTATVAAGALSPAFRKVAAEEVVGGVKGLGQVFAMIAPTVIRAASSVLAFTSAITAPIWLSVAAVGALVTVFIKGKQNVEDFNKVIEDAGKLGVSADFFQRYTKGAEALKMKTEEVIATLERFEKVTRPKLGGSDFDRVLKQLQDWGNFAGNSGVKALQQANSIQEKYAAAGKLIEEAIKKGERLAALKLAETFLSEAQMTRLRQTSTYFSDLERAAKDVKDTDLVSAENLAKAADLKNRLDAAYAVLNERWKLVLPDITALSLKLYGVWVNIVELIASAVDKIVGAISAGLKFISEHGGGEAPAERLGAARRGGREARVAARAAVTGEDYAEVDRQLQEQKARQDAVNKSTTEATQRQENFRQGVEKLKVAMPGYLKNMEELNDRQKDTSKSAKETNDEWQKAIDRISRRITQQEAEAAAADKGVGAQARLRVELELQELAKQRNIPLNDKMKKQIEELASRAETAAIAIHKMKVELEIKRELEGMALGLSDQELQIAEKLKDIYPNINDALRSGLGERLKLVDNLKEARSIATDFGTTFTSTFVSNLRNGTSAAQSFSSAMLSALQRVEDKLLEMITKQLMQRAFGGALSAFFPGIGTEGAGSFSASDAALNRSLFPNYGAGAPQAVQGHSGGVVGADLFPSRKVAPIHFVGAPRFQGGGLMPGEFPAVLHQGEAVLTPAQMSALARGGGGSGNQQVVNVQVVNSHSGARVNTQQQKGPGGEMNIRVLVDQIEGRMAENMRRGTGPMPLAVAGRFGLNSARGNVG